MPRIVEDSLRGAPVYVFFGSDQRVIAANPGDGHRLGKRSSTHCAGLLAKIYAGETILLVPFQDEYWVEGDPVHLAKPQMALAAPIYDEQDPEQPIAAVLVRNIGLEKQFFELLQHVRAGKSGETYAFDVEGTLISESRFNDQLRMLGLIDDDPNAYSCLRIQIRDPGGNLLNGFQPDTPIKTRPLTRMAAFATAGEPGTEMGGYHDYRGVSVVGAWTWLPEYGFGITTEIDYDEAYKPMRLLKVTFGGILLLIVTSVGVVMYSSMSVARLRRQARELQQVGAYKIVEGGMGEVYLARHALLKRPTAVKMLRPEQINSDSLARFEREVQMVSQLNNPNTIEVYDYGRTPDGIFYYAMEYIDGLTLSQLVRREGPIPPGRVVHIFKSVCTSLREAHAQGLVHRDIKPQNIMLCRRGGESDVVKVLDFGLVTHIDGDTEKLTRTMGVIGTPLYIAPERLREPRNNDPRSDIYSLGAVMYNLLTGRELFADVSEIDVYHHVLNTVPPRVRDWIDTIPVELDQLVADCLEKLPDHRPAGVGEILKRLETIHVKWSFEEAEIWWQTYTPGTASQRSSRRRANK